MIFYWFPTDNIFIGKLLYIQQDYAFSFSPKSGLGITSLVIDTLQLTIDKKGHVLNVWGYCPYQSWQLSEISPPNYIRGSLFVQLEEITPQISEQIAGLGEWKILVNSSTGWVCIGEEKSSPSSKAIEFASNSVAVVEENCLKAVWLRPENLLIR
jgi:hypothetical protein